MSRTYLCIHGHFYQPPRENPWLDIIEVQPSAQPFHDWNERITRECYAPNSRARVLGDSGRIERLINNYEYMSFNFGPTLLSWLEQAHPKVYQSIIQADQASQERCYGHGNALAQVYNHIIMPLADRRDQMTQIRWGKADFKARFGRDPEGMWLAETAVNTETLVLLAREGFKFTILSPAQARAVRPLTGQDRPGKWKDVSGGWIDPRQAYRAVLDPVENLYLDLFFYDGPVSRAVAFERLLTSGATFLNRLNQAVGADTGRPRLVNLATDGESYGHHFKFGEMALAWVYNQIEKNSDFIPINYGAFLELHPSEWEVKIIDDTAWSCAHGVERWRSDCGCQVGHRPGWNQAWRTPLRKGLDWLRDRLQEIYQEHGPDLFNDPWAARDDYIRVMLDPGPETVSAFLADHAVRTLTDQEKIKAWRLLGSQVMSLFMFTSCGWFFDDISGLEPIQDLKYAARAMELSEPFSRHDLQAGLMEYLALAKSNRPKHGDGLRIFKKYVETARISPAQAAAHFGLRHVIQNGQLEPCPVSHLVQPLRQRRLTGPGLEVVLGEVKVSDRWAGREDEAAFLAIHQGGLALACLAGPWNPSFDLDAVIREIRPDVDSVSPERIEKAFLRHLPEADRFGLQDLLPDSRHALALALAGEARDNFNAWIYQFFDTHQDLLQILEETKGPDTAMPAFIYTHVVSDRLARLLEEGLSQKGLNWQAVQLLAEQAQTWGVILNNPEVTQRALAIITAGLNLLAERPEQEVVSELTAFLQLSEDLNLNLDIWAVQNRFYDLVLDPDFRKGCSAEVRAAVTEVGQMLGFEVEMK